MTDQPVTRGGIALVLGGGGPVGHAFHCGVLAAIEAATGWDPRHADLVLGTSAGAQVAALLRAGMSTSDLTTRLSGAELSPEGARIASLYVRPDQPEGHFLPIPQAPEILLHALRHPRHLSLIDIGVGLAPKGRVSMQPMIEGVNAMFDAAWPDRTWITARDLNTGDLVVFKGRGDKPTARFGEAVAASGAVPGRSVPVRIDGRSFVDGGTHSPTNADLVGPAQPRVVIVSSPLTLPPEDRAGAGDVLKRLLRRRLREELSRLPADTRTVVFEPPASLRQVMGWNPMKTDLMGPVAEATAETFSAHEATDRLGKLLTAA
ncbi:MAG: patatin-like phospholipase family protein [Acidimicrobiia bacterium]|nr:patatin-like phospholipase family protein [Acidimicrobiia bacterium]